MNQAGTATPIGNDEIYKYPPAAGWVCIGFGLLLLTLPYCGARLEFSTMLGDFASLVDTLYSKRAVDSPGTGASIQKLQDQRRRASLVRRLNWLAGIAVIGAAIAIAIQRWRH
jgi:hypothetical protein